MEKEVCYEPIWQVEYNLPNQEEKMNSEIFFDDRFFSFIGATLLASEHPIGLISDCNVNLETQTVHWQRQHSNRKLIGVLIFTGLMVGIFILNSKRRFSFSNTFNLLRKSF